ncbi:STING domain-containing protein [Hydrogenophaga sp. IBVHS2]|uniref:STING domain-containing protein n=1 Tax=Hydrogenophaga sp. IBVHS2 TaxID=1985170 RepID=UPI00117B297F|nr:STING domain-containing protein [Hydrogenophaga sp. IBVHS2]
MNHPRRSPFLHHVGAGLLQVVGQPRFLPAVLAGGAVLLIQIHAAWQAWHHGVEVPWAGHAATVLTTLAAVWVAVAVVRADDTQAPNATSLFSVARGLATGYYFNFLQPLLRSLRQAGAAPASEHGLFTVLLDGRPLDRLPALHGLVVAIPCQDHRLCRTPAAGAALIARRCSGLRMHTVVFDRIRTPGGVWSRPIELRLMQADPLGPAVLLDVPTTLNVVHETLSARPGPDGSDSPARQATEHFVQVLNEFREVVAQVGGADPLRQSSPLQVHVVPAEVAEHRIRELLASGA